MSACFFLLPPNFCSKSRQTPHWGITLLPPQVLADSRTTFFFFFFSASCCSAVLRSLLRSGTKASVRAQATSNLLCDAYMLFCARQGYLCLLSAAEFLYQLLPLAAGDPEKSQEIYFPNPLTATEFARSDSRGDVINILLRLFFFPRRITSSWCNLIG